MRGSWHALHAAFFALGCASAPAPVKTEIVAPSSEPSSAPVAVDPPPDDPEKVVAGLAPGFRRCYHAGLRITPNMKGTLRLLLIVGPSGEVESATVSDVEGFDDSVVACLKTRASEARFAPPKGGRAELPIPVSFSPGEPQRL